jgi:hypothetical protein
MFRDFRLDPEHGGYDIFVRTTGRFITTVSTPVKADRKIKLQK